MRIKTLLLMKYLLSCIFFVWVTHALKFNADGTFKIVQFTGKYLYFIFLFIYWRTCFYAINNYYVIDLHFGEAEDTLWGPIQDVNSTRYYSEK